MRRALVSLSLVAALAAPVAVVPLAGPPVAAQTGGVTPIMGRSALIADQLVAWYRSTGRVPRLHGVTLEEVARLFVEEGENEGVRGDIAFAQSIFETDYFHFSDRVPPDLHNYAGFGAPSNPVRFPDARTGIRAQIQHLRAYADPTVDETGTATPLVDPRWDHIDPKGIAPTWEELSERWSTGSEYGQKIVALYLRIREHAGPTLRDRLLEAQIVGAAEPQGGGGIWLADGQGGVFALGAPFFGSVPGLRAAGMPVPHVPVTGMAAWPGGPGYWSVDAKGGIFSFGDAPFLGSVPALRAAGVPVGDVEFVGMAPTPSGGGYWLVDETGGVFAFGDAPYFGSIPALRAAGSPIGAADVVAIVGSPSGGGYWLVDERGGVFAFGDAPYHGSIPALRAEGRAIGDQAFVALAATPTGNGYWLVDAQGGVFAMGSAPFRGTPSASGLRYVSIVRMGAGDAYRLVSADGAVIAYR